MARNVCIRVFSTVPIFGRIIARYSPNFEYGSYMTYIGLIYGLYRTYIRDRWVDEK